MIKKTQGLIKGVPSAVLMSALIHLGLFFAAGTMVVFSVIKKHEKKFVPPPPIERPKMDLKKPKVKVKKTVKPRASQRITSSSIQSMPEIALPEVSSAGSGLSGGVGGFEMMPDPSEMTLYGGAQSASIGNDFEGTFYATGLDRRGQRNGQNPGESYYKELGRFLDSGWNPRSFSRYYRSPQKLYATFFYIPMSASETVPRSFGIADDVYTMNWCAHYKGKMMSKNGGRFRFWGRGENVLVVRLSGKIVLVGGHIQHAKTMSNWRSTAKEHREYYRGHGPMGVGDWFDLEPGVPVEMEVLFGDTGGAWTQATLTIEEDGEDYDKNEEGAPILPVFRTAEIPPHLIDEIYESMIEGEADLFSDLTFNVY